MRGKQPSIPTIAGLLVITGGLLAGLALVRLRFEYKTQAMEETQPRDIKISNTDASSATVSWITERAATGSVKYGESQSDLNMTVGDVRDQQIGNVGAYRTHYITIEGLKPETVYKLVLKSGTTDYDLDGQPYTVATGPLIDQLPEADVAYGQVVTGDGDPAGGAIVYLQMPGAGLMSALVKDSGSWVIPVAKSRTLDGSKYIKYDPENETVKIWVQDADLGMAEVTSLTSLDSPVPNIKLGNTYDFTKAAAGTENTGKSKITVESPVINTNQLLLLAPLSAENIQTGKPVVLGEAPPGTDIIIEINSEEKITTTVQSGSDGKFSYQIPTTLAAGTHTITVTAVIGGIKKNITRSFVVSAAENSQSPYYSATPSATLKPTVKPSPTLLPTATIKPTVAPVTAVTGKPTPTVRPTSTPKPTSTPIPTSTPRITSTPMISSPTPTPTAIPRSGAAEVTLMMLVMGVGLVLTGGWWYRKLE